MSIFVDNWVRKYCRNKWKIDPMTVNKQPKPAMVYGEIPYKTIIDVMPKEYLNPNNNTVYQTRPYTFDSKYKVTSIDEVKRFLAWDKTNNEGYTKEFYDCDDFAFSLFGRIKTWTKGLAHGVIITMAPAHAKNVVIDSHNGVWEIEPQSDVVKPLDSLVHIYMF